MRDVVVIGGGLSGLVAACELEKHTIKYTLIEVKRRLGGSIESVTKGGYIFDNGPMCHTITDKAFFDDYLAQIGLDNAIFTVDDGKIAFKQGTGILVDTLARKITAPVMQRMAASTLGTMDNEKRLAICMENGMLLDAGALIVAAPARYAERMLYTFSPELGFKLLDYPYDSVARVSLGYVKKTKRKGGNKFPAKIRKEEMIFPPKDDAIIDIQYIDNSSRTAENGVIVQVAVKVDPQIGLPDDIIDTVIEKTGLHGEFVASHIAVWSESDPVDYLDDKHIEKIKEIKSMLPDGVELTGSDYIETTTPPTLDERIKQGIEAAKRIIERMNRER